jgi:hypothetical protein
MIIRIEIKMENPQKQNKQGNKKNKETKNQKQTIKQSHQVQKQYNFSLSLHSGFSPLTLSPGIDIYAEALCGLTR